MVHKAVLVLAGSLVGWWMLPLVLDRDLGLNYVLNRGLALMVLWLTFATLSTAMVRGRLEDLLSYMFAAVMAVMAGSMFSTLYEFH